MKIFLLLAAVLNAVLSPVTTPATSVGIIGGADGPTAIYVAEGDEDMDMNMNIWNTTDELTFVIDMYDLLVKKCSYGDNMDMLTAEEQVFYIVCDLEMEVNNGGFSQFFFNSSGDNANAVEAALRTVGANATADIYKKAYAAYCRELPADTEERRTLLEEIETDEVYEILSDCDSEFYAYPDDLAVLLYDYAMENKENFDV